MVINRSDHDGGYVCISTAVLRDTSISLAARGLLCMLLANSESWKLSTGGLCAQTGLCKTTVQRLLRELRDAGYIHTQRIHDGKRIIGCEWVVNEDRRAISLKSNQPKLLSDCKTIGLKSNRIEKQEDSNLSLINNINNNNYQYKEISNVISNKSVRFKAPTREELTEFAVAYGNDKDINAVDNVDRFIDYYTANGWKVGRNCMKDWRAAFRNWCNRNYNKAPKIEKSVELDWEEIARAASEGIGG